MWLTSQENIIWNLKSICSGLSKAKVGSKSELEIRKFEGK